VAIRNSSNMENMACHMVMGIWPGNPVPLLIQEPVDEATKA
jgi:hypothetical protein